MLIRPKQWQGALALCAFFGTSVAQAAPKPARGADHAQLVQQLDSLNAKLDLLGKVVDSPAPSSPQQPIVRVAKSPAHRAQVALRWKIRGLDREIKATEQAQAGKYSWAGYTIQKIAAREKEIERNQEQNRTLGIFGALLGMPLVAVVGAVKVKDDDTRLQQLRSSLAVLKREHAELAARIAAHRESKATLLADVAKLSDAAKDLSQELAHLERGPQPTFTSVVEVRAHVATTTALLANLREQVSILTEVKQSADTLGVAIDAHLASAKTELARAEQLVQKSNEAVVDYLMMLLSGRPEVAARKWINKRLTSEITKVFVDAGLKGPAGKEIAKQLAKRLVGGDRNAADGLATAIENELDESA